MARIAKGDELGNPCDVCDGLRRGAWITGAIVSGTFPPGWTGTRPEWLERLDRADEVSTAFEREYWKHNKETGHDPLVGHPLRPMTRAQNAGVGVLIMLAMLLVAGLGIAAIFAFSK